MTNSTEQDRRAAYTAGLRQLADILDNHPEVPLPYEGSLRDAGRFSFHFLHLGEEARTEMASVRRALGVPLEKTISHDKYFDLKGNLHGLYFTLTAFRKDVCQRVVVATREVEVTEPDPKAVAALPTVTRKVEIEDVEWVCSPILAAGEHDKAVAGS